MSVSLKDLSRAMLDGRISVDERSPIAPLFLSERVADRTLFVSSFANVTAFETGEGLVLVDTGSFLLAEPTRAVVRQVLSAPLHTAVFTHGHVDHCFGVERYESEPGGARARVVAHDAVLRRFERYRLTRGWNASINARQFRTDVAFPSVFRAPDVTYQEELRLEVGGRAFELHHALGETDDHTWIWVPDERVLCTGDLFIWASPNCGNPQKVQRYPREWAQALRAMAALGAETLCPGHGLPICGAADVRRALEETAELLESLVSQVLRLMNEGAGLERVLTEVRAPAALLARPYLAPVYDEPEFVVRNLFRLYGGWWDGNPAHLKPARADALARELAALAGGVPRLVARAAELREAGEHALASHLVEQAALAAPSDVAVHHERARVYAARAATERSLMARGVFETAAEESKTLGK